jgi:hypothetical protein
MISGTIYVRIINNYFYIRINFSKNTLDMQELTASRAVGIEREDITMSHPSQRLASEAISLWVQLFHEGAPSHLEGAELIDLALKRLPEENYHVILRPRREARID